MERSDATAAEEAILGFLQSKEEISKFGRFCIECRDRSCCNRQCHQEPSWIQIRHCPGSPVVQFFLAVPPEGISHEELQKKVNPAVYKIGRSQASKNKWVEMGKTLVELSRKVEHIADRAEDLLQRVHDGKVIDTKDIEDLKKRKLITLLTWKG
ncbi:hypothetical protein AAC387_Pa01g2716 [Persea americana]